MTPSLTATLGLWESRARSKQGTRQGHEIVRSDATSAPSDRTNPIVGGKILHRRQRTPVRLQKLSRPALPPPWLGVNLDPSPTFAASALRSSSLKTGGRSFMYRTTVSWSSANPSGRPSNSCQTRRHDHRDSTRLPGLTRKHRQLYRARNILAQQLDSEAWRCPSRESAVLMGLPFASPESRGCTPTHDRARFCCE